MLVRRRGAGQAAVVRARIVLAADAEPGATNMAIAARLGISRQGLVPDNAATHETRAVHDRLLKRPRRHCTPTASAWLNRVEAWFSLLTRRCLQRGALDSTDGLEAAIHAYIDHTNAEPRPSAWAKSADDILASPQRFCQKTSNPEH